MSASEQPTENYEEEILAAGDDLDEAEFSFEGTRDNAEDDRFDEIVGHLEEILMDEEFTNLQRDFMWKNCEPFEDSEENKLVYTSVFNDYIAIIEKYIDQRLKEKLPGFEMDDFLTLLEEREDQIAGDLWDVLTSFSDFPSFKELVLSYKQEKDADATTEALRPEVICKSPKSKR